MSLSLVVRFEDQSPSYAHGVELGRIMHAMELGESMISNNGFPVRVENKATLIDMCRHHGYSAEFGVVWYEEWVSFRAVKRAKLN